MLVSSMLGLTSSARVALSSNPVHASDCVNVCFAFFFCIRWLMMKCGIMEYETNLALLELDVYTVGSIFHNETKS